MNLPVCLSVCPFVSRLMSGSDSHKIIQLSGILKSCSSFPNIKLKAAKDKRSSLLQTKVIYTLAF
jgi:hypothetical protein